LSDMLRNYADRIDAGDLTLDGAHLDLACVGGIGADGVYNLIQSGRQRIAFYLTNTAIRERATDKLGALTGIEPESFISDYTMRDAIAADVDRLMTLLGAA